MVQEGVRKYKRNLNKMRILGKGETKKRFLVPDGDGR